jgi:hypothetical protein
MRYIYLVVFAAFAFPGVVCAQSATPNTLIPSTILQPRVVHVA